MQTETTAELKIAAYRASKQLYNLDDAVATGAAVRGAAQLVSIPKPRLHGMHAVQNLPQLLRGGRTPAPHVALGLRNSTHAQNKPSSIHSSHYVTPES